MLNALKDLLTSKKFWITVIGSAVTTGLSLAGAPHEVVLGVAGLFGSGVVGQGFADFGKNQK